MKTLFSLFIGICLCLLPARAAEPVSLFSELPSGDKLVVNFSSAGCYHAIDLKFTYLPIGDGQFEIGVVRPGFVDELERVALKPEESKKMDALLAYYRSNPQGKCTTVDLIRIRQFRGDVLVGEESFRDGSCGSASQKPPLLTFMHFAYPLFKPKEYGEKTPTTVRVQVRGDSIDRQGYHHIETKNALRELLTQAGFESRPGHKLSITRAVIPQVYRNFEFKIGSASEWEMANFKLQAGDEVVVVAPK